MNVAEWLRGLRLEQYAPAFRDNDIDGEVLRRLTADDLRDLGVASIGHRRRLLDAIAALREGQLAESRPPVQTRDTASGSVARQARRSAGANLDFYRGRRIDCRNAVVAE
jgi:hypothetical protein